MKRYRYSTKNDPELFSAALDYLRSAKEFTGNAEEFFAVQDYWNTIPLNLDMYFMYRPYLEIMGLQDQLDKEIKRIIGDEEGWYPYDERYGFHVRMTGSGNNIIQLAVPQRSETEFRDGGIIPFDEWETDEEAIKWFKYDVIEEIPELEIEIVPPVDGVNL